ncbi:magnesium transporter [Euzebya rosea]|uniref:magnesium transporter n=1 Tax=Euzebya rosea TaxID=2052804 RepID=UPI000D3E6B7F|nr:magnesium transporter [Euzebya rosea]
MSPRPLSRAVAAFLAGVRALVGLLRRHARFPVLTEVLQHWLHEQRTVRQGVLALSIGIGITLVAGVVLGAMDALLEELPGLLVLAPAAIGMRGAIFGALGARLGTGMLTGQMDGSFARTSFLGRNVEAATVLSVITAVILAAAARLVGVIGGFETISFTDFVLISMIGTILSSFAVLAVVIVLARTAQRQEWDMDAIGTPIVAASADISTLPALVVGTFAVGNETASGIIGWAFVVLAVTIGVLGLRTASSSVRRIVRESLPILLYTAAMGILAGTVLESRKADLLSSVALLVAVPPFISSSGAIGGILSARLSSQLHLGLLEPTSVPRRPAWLEGSLTVLFGLVGYFAVGLLTAIAAGLLGYGGPGLLPLLGVTMTAGVLALFMIFAVGYYAATASFRFGLDPDNVGIPLVTSTMDFVGILCLTVGIVVIL